MDLKFVTTRYGKTNKMNRRGGYYNLQTKIGGGSLDIVTPNTIAIKKLRAALNKKNKEGQIKESTITTYLNKLKFSEHIRFMYMPFLAEAIVIHRKIKKDINYKHIEHVSEILTSTEMKKNITNEEFSIIKCRIFETILRYIYYLKYYYDEEEQ